MNLRVAFFSLALSFLGMWACLGLGGLAGSFCFCSFPLADFNISIFILVP